MQRNLESRVTVQAGGGFSRRTGASVAVAGQQLPRLAAVNSIFAVFFKKSAAFFLMFVIWLFAKRLQPPAAISSPAPPRPRL
jgi:hypothetical protein